MNLLEENQGKSRKMKNLYEESIWRIYMKIHESMQQKKEKESESVWKIEKGKMHIEYESSGIIHVGEDATLSYRYRPKPKGHNLAVFFCSFLLLNIVRNSFCFSCNLY